MIERPPLRTFYGSPMSALGQKQTSKLVLVMSALSPKADICNSRHAVIETFLLAADPRAFLGHRTFHHKNDDHQRKHRDGK